MCAGLHEPNGLVDSSSINILSRKFFLSFESRELRPAKYVHSRIITVHCDVMKFIF